MRVAIFSNTYYPAVNGVAKCTEYYARGLQERGHEVVIFAPCPEEYDRSQDPDNIYRFPSFPIPLDIDYSIAVPYSRPVVKALRRLNFDVIHTQHPFWVGAWGAWYARWAELPLVTTVHTHYQVFAHMLPFPEPLVEAYMRLRLTRYCNKCDVITTPVHSMHGILREEGVRTPIEIVANPTDVRAFAQGDGRAIRLRHGLGPDDVVLGFVGRLSPEKNLGFLLEAVRRVVRRHPQVAFLVVGEGTKMEELSTQARALGLEERVIFTGPVDHARMPDYQAAFDLFVTASRSETQPLAYTEAMAAGKPVVAVETPGAQDMIKPGRNGLLAPRQAGPEALAARIEELVTDPQRRQEMGCSAQEGVRQFDFAQVAERLEHVYHRAEVLSEEEPI